MQNADNRYIITRQEIKEAAAAAILSDLEMKVNLIWWTCCVDMEHLVAIVNIVGQCPVCLVCHPPSCVPCSQ